MADKFYYFASGLVALTLLGAIFMVTQCSMRETEISSQAEVVCTAAGGDWVKLPASAGRCFRPSR